MKQVQILRNKGYSLRAEEEQLYQRLVSMDRDFQKPSVFRGRINEIYAQIQQQKDANRLFLGAYANSESDLLTLSDPNAIKPVVQGLEEMTKGLQQLTQVINEDEESLNFVERGYQEGSLHLDRKK